MWSYLLLAAVFGAVATERISSPCKDLFEYDEEREPGHWEGTLTLKTDHKLHGIWVRVFFDKPVKKLELLDHRSGEVKSDNSTEFLIKNRETVLKKNEPLKVRFTVGYEGGAAPALIGYRLNARDVCPEGLD